MKTYSEMKRQHALSGNIRTSELYLHIAKTSSQGLGIPFRTHIPLKNHGQCFSPFSLYFAPVLPFLALCRWPVCALTALGRRAGTSMLASIPSPHNLWIICMMATFGGSVRYAHTPYQAPFSSIWKTALLILGRGCACGHFLCMFALCTWLSNHVEGNSVLLLPALPSSTVHKCSVQGFVMQST